MDEGEIKGVESILEKKSSEAISLIKPNSIYFAHPINIYSTPYEELIVKKLENFFPGKNIENPNQKHHSENYQLWRNKTQNGMTYFLEVILNSEKIVGGVYLPFEDGMIGAGIFKEMKKVEELGKPIFEVRSEKIIKKINKLDISKKLSVEETRERVYKK